jgi:prophage regulatory protein
LVVPKRRIFPRRSEAELKLDASQSGNDLKKACVEMEQTNAPTRRTRTRRQRKPRARRGSLFNTRAAEYRAPHNMLDPLRLMKVNEVAVALCVHPMTIWKWVADGKFPKPVKLGPQIVVWQATEIAEWLKAKAAETGEASTEMTIAAE